MILLPDGRPYLPAASPMAEATVRYYNKRALEILQKRFQFHDHLPPTIYGPDGKAVISAFPVARGETVRFRLPIQYEEDEDE